MDEEEIERQIQREVQADWRDMLITRIGGLNGRRVEELSLAELEWADKTWMPQIRMRWFEVDVEIKRHYFALECALQAVRPSLGRPIPAAPPRPPEPEAESALSEPPKQSFKPQMPLAAPQQRPETPLRPPEPPPIATRRRSASDDVRQEKDDSSAPEDPCRQEAVAPVPEEEATEQMAEGAKQPGQLSVLRKEEQQHEWLASKEQRRLAELERTIEEGLATFVEIGSALSEIRDKRLYRQTHPTFEAYCQQKWAMAARRAKQLIGAAEVVSNLKGESVTGVAIPTQEKHVRIRTRVLIPTHEKHVRPLVELGAEQQRSVWQKSVEASQGRPSEQQVRKIRDAMFPECKPKPKKLKRKVEKGAVAMELESVTAPPVPVSENAAPSRHFMALLKDFGEHPDNYDGELFAGDEKLVALYQVVRGAVFHFSQGL